MVPPTGSGPSRISFRAGGTSSRAQIRALTAHLTAKLRTTLASSGRAGCRPSRSGARPGWCSAFAWEHVVLQPDSPARALCAGCGGASPIAVALERYQCVPARRGCPRASIAGSRRGSARTSPPWRLRREEAAPASASGGAWGWVCL